MYNESVSINSLFSFCSCWILDLPSSPHFCVLTSLSLREDGIDVEKHGGPGYALTEEWPPKVTETPKSESVSEVANGERRSVTFAAGKGISEKAFAPAAGPSSSSQAGPSAERL